MRHLQAGLETWLISLVKMKENRKPGGMAEKCGGGFAERRASGTLDVWLALGRTRTHDLLSPFHAAFSYAAVVVPYHTFQ